MRTNCTADCGLITESGLNCELRTKLRIADNYHDVLAMRFDFRPFDCSGWLRCGSAYSCGCACGRGSNERGRQLRHGGAYADDAASSGDHCGLETRSRHCFRRDPQGNFVLIGAMYTAPKRYSAADLDERVPTSIAQWHKHVNWCVPRLGSRSRWSEVKNGRPVFGPLGVSTREECNSAGGRFHEEVLGWMVHANVFEREVWGDHQMRGDELGTDEN